MFEQGDGITPVALFFLCMNFASIWEGIKDRLGDTSKWGQWIGAVIIADILGLWTYACIKKGEVLVLDTNLVAVLLTVFVMNGLKRPKPEVGVTGPVGEPGPAGLQGAQGFQGYQGEPAVREGPSV